MSGLLDQATGLDVAAQAVDLARRAGADEAEAWLVRGQSSKVRVREGEVDERSDAETGTLTLRVFAGTQTALATAADLAPDSLQRLAEDALGLARLSDPDPCAGLPEGPFPAKSGDALGLSDPALVTMAPGVLLDLARQADAAAREFDPLVRSGEGATASRWAGVTTLVNSRGMAASYPATHCTVFVSAAAEDDAGKHSEGWWYSSARQLATLADAVRVGRLAAERARRQLGARPVPTQTVPVVWSTEAAPSWLELMAEAVSGDARYRGATFLLDREGETIASPLLTITDDATLPGRMGSRPFDAEGLASQRTPVVTGGTFNGFLHDTYSGRKAGQASTANSVRFSSQAGSMAPRVGPSNLVMAGGDQTPEAIIGGVQRGLYLTDTMGFGVNLTTGDFSRGATGLWIENGELTFPVSEVNIAGNVLEMLAGIDAVGNDVTVLDTIAAPTFRMAQVTVSGR